MRIGIVNMHKDPIKIQRIERAITGLGASSYILSGTMLSTKELSYKIRSSSIRHWIFSGSPYHITHEDSHHIPMDLLHSDKQFLMICYSMESVLIQLGIPIRERYIHRKEPFQITVPREQIRHPLFKGIPNPMKVWRDHRWYFPNAVLRSPVHLLASYNGEAMIATYKNMTLVQHHPERTVDGRLFLKNWLDI